MNEATIALTAMTFLIFVIFIAFLIWGIRSGQFRNVEEAKYLPLEGNEPEREKNDDGDEHHRHCHRRR
jgi:nitrogen fixation-related uncharacterized protein